MHVDETRVPAISLRAKHATGALDDSPSSFTRGNSNGPLCLGEINSSVNKYRPTKALIPRAGVEVDRVTTAFSNSQES